MKVHESPFFYDESFECLRQEDGRGNHNHNDDDDDDIHGKP